MFEIDYAHWNTDKALGQRSELVRVVGYRKEIQKAAYCM